MATRPTTLPEFASSGTVLEPSGAKKATGWVVEKPSYQEMNWIHQTTYLWTEYFSEIVDEISAGDVRVRHGDGALATPSITFESDLNTGLYLSAPNIMHLVADGTDVAKVESTGFTVNQPLYVGSGLDSDGAVVLNLGITNATEINIADTGILTDIQGTLSVNEAAVFDSTLAINGALASTAIASITNTNGSAKNSLVINHSAASGGADYFAFDVSTDGVGMRINASGFAGTSTEDLFRITVAGFNSFTFNYAGQLDLLCSQASGITHTFENANTGNSATCTVDIVSDGGNDSYSQMRLSNDINSIGNMFKNSSTRTSFGGINSLNIFNGSAAIYFFPNGLSVPQFKVDTLTATVGNTAASGTARYQMSTSNGTWSIYSSSSGGLYFDGFGSTFGTISNASAWTFGDSTTKNQTHTFYGRLLQLDCDSGSFAYMRFKNGGSNIGLVGQTGSGDSYMDLFGVTGIGLRFYANNSFVGEIDTSEIWRFKKAGTEYGTIREAFSGISISTVSGTSGYLAVSGAQYYVWDTTAFRPFSDNSRDLGQLLARWDDVYATNGTIQTSDAKEKEDIKDSNLGLSFFNLLRGTAFKRKGGKRTHHGLIAQEVEQALLKLGLTSKDAAMIIRSKDRYGMRYDEMWGPLVQAINEITDRITSLETKVA